MSSNTRPRTTRDIDSVAVIAKGADEKKRPC
jgi:hypothetical protein